MKITPKQLEIILLLYKFRFLNTNQVQTLLQHKDNRRIKSWLKDLNDKKIIFRIYSKKIGENTKPAIYCLDSASKKIVQDHKEINKIFLNRVYKEKTRSKEFIDHSLFIASIYLNFLKLAETNNSKFEFLTKSTLLNLFTDAYININNKKYLIEIWDKKEADFILKKRTKKLINHFVYGDFKKENNENFPIILLICFNEKAKIYLNSFISQILVEEGNFPLNFLISSLEIIKNESLENIKWQSLN
jgi:hypothetical protein